MNLSFHNKHVPARLARRMRRVAIEHSRSLAIAAIGLTGVFGYAGQALAQAASPTGGIGAQMNLMSSEATNAGSLAFGMGCYLAAAVVLFLRRLGRVAVPAAAEPRDRLCRSRNGGSRAVRSVRVRGRVDQQGVDLCLGRCCHGQRYPRDGAVRHRRLTRQAACCRTCSWFFQPPQQASSFLGDAPCVKLPTFPSFVRLVTCPTGLPKPLQGWLLAASVLYAAAATTLLPHKLPATGIIDVFIAGALPGLLMTLVLWWHVPVCSTGAFAAG